MKRLLILLTLGLATACGSPEEPEEPSLVQTLMADEVALDRGRAIFEGTCANYCHGGSAEVAATVFPGAANLFDCEWVHGSSDDALFRTIVSGIPDTRMVGFGSNFPEGDADLWKVIAYVKSKQPACEAQVAESAQEQTDIE